MDPASLKRARRRTSGERQDELQFQLMFALCLVPFLMLAVIGRLTGWRYQRWPASGERRQSVLQEACETARTSVELSFMGW